MKFVHTLIQSALMAATFAVTTHAQELCTHSLLDQDMIVNMEGWFINAQHSRARIDIEWRHHEAAKRDTFFIHLPNTPSYKYITDSTSRYIEKDSPRIRRQMAMHHLKEEIGNTPVRYDDLELLAHGLFMCKDSSIQKPTIFSTAFSQMWWSIASDSLPQPHLVTMRGAFKEKREMRIDTWKELSGTPFPTLVTVAGMDYRGKFWIRSAYPMEDLSRDPLREHLLKFGHDYGASLWIGNEK